MYEDIESVLIDRDAIHARIKEMAARLEEDYRGETVVMNSPSDGNERKVLDHFLILDDLSVAKRPSAK